jgi:hypothetical protein
MRAHTMLDLRRRDLFLGCARLKDAAVRDRGDDGPVEWSECDSARDDDDDSVSDGELFAACANAAADRPVEELGTLAGSHHDAFFE